MTDSPFAAELKVQFHVLPPRLQEAARSIIDHPVDVAVPTLREQARCSGLAHTALARLAQRFGMPGYNGLCRRYGAGKRGAGVVALTASEDQLAASDAYLRPAERRLRL